MGQRDELIKAWNKINESIMGKMSEEDGKKLIASYSKMRQRTENENKIIKKAIETSKLSASKLSKIIAACIKDFTSEWEELKKGKHYYHKLRRNERPLLIKKMSEKWGISYQTIYNIVKFNK